LAFTCFPVAARGRTMGALEQGELPRISAMATVLKTISAMGTRPRMQSLPWPPTLQQACLHAVIANSCAACCSSK
jgi:hypothetical protein